MKPIYSWIIVALVVLAGLSVWLPKYDRSPLADAADRFLARIAAQDWDGLHAHAAAGFRQGRSPDDLAQIFSRTALTDYKRAEWETVSVDGSRGAVTGNVLTHAGDQLPLAIHLSREEGKWKVLALELPAWESIRVRRADDVPSDPDILAMVDEGIAAIGEAMQTRNFTNFYYSISRMWQQQTSPDHLWASYGLLIQEGIDIAALRGTEPVLLQEPGLTAYGALDAKGVYPVDPVPVSFDFQYVQEGGAWKLIGARIRVVRVTEPNRPD